MIHENIYSIPGLVFLGILAVGWYVTSQLQLRARYTRLGAKPAVMVSYKLPFGFDTLWEGIQVFTQ